MLWVTAPISSFRHIHAFHHFRFETRRRRRHAIGAWRQVRNAIEPRIVRHGFGFDPGLRFRHGNVHTRNSRAGGIRDQARDRAALALRKERRRQAQQNQRQNGKTE
jgi:hypothetical protein